MKKKIALAMMSVFWSTTMFAQEAQDEFGDVVEDVVEVTDGYPVKNLIITILVFLAFAWMLGHMIYEIWLRPNPFADINENEMKALRSAAGQPAEMSEDEENMCRQLLEDDFDNWTPLPDDPDGSRIVTSRKQMKHAEKTFAQIRELKPTNPEVIEMVNHLGSGLREARKRSFTGSKVLLFLLVLVAAFFVWQVGWKSLIFFIFNAATYILASLTPNFMTYKRELKGSKGSGALNWILGGAFGMIAGAQTVRTVTKWSDGTTTTEDDHTQHLVAWVLAIIIALILVFFMFVWAIVNYLRNYVIYW